jgi:hypothetical protein
MSWQKEEGWRFSVGCVTFPCMPSLLCPFFLLLPAFVGLDVYSSCFLHPHFLAYSLTRLLTHSLAITLPRVHSLIPTHPRTHTRTHQRIPPPLPHVQPTLCSRKMLSMDRWCWMRTSPICSGTQMTRTRLASAKIVAVERVMMALRRTHLHPSGAAARVPRQTRFVEHTFHRAAAATAPPPGVGTRIAAVGVAVLTVERSTPTPTTPTTRRSATSAEALPLVAVYHRCTRWRHPPPPPPRARARTRAARPASTSRALPAPQPRRE